MEDSQDDDFLENYSVVKHKTHLSKSNWQFSQTIRFIEDSASLGILTEASTCFDNGLNCAVCNFCIKGGKKLMLTL